MRKEIFDHFRAVFWARKPAHWQYPTARRQARTPYRSARRLKLWGESERKESEALERIVDHFGRSDRFGRDGSLSQACEGLSRIRVPLRLRIGVANSRKFTEQGKARSSPDAAVPEYCSSYF